MSPTPDRVDAVTLGGDGPEAYRNPMLVSVGGGVSTVDNGERGAVRRDRTRGQTQPRASIGCVALPLGREPPWT